jgi:DNA-binding MarR family transcriptional regulator
MKKDFAQRFGFLVSDVAKLYGEQFDRLARQSIGLSRAQCRVLGALAMHGDDRQPLSQAEIAQWLGLSAMTVGGLCDRLEAASWVRRRPSATDRRINEVLLEPRAEKALDAALTIGDALSARALSGLAPAERVQLLALLGKARQGLAALPAAGAGVSE